MIRPAIGKLCSRRLGIEPPPRQTCLVLTLSELGKRDLRRTIGRPMLGRPPGKLQQLAVGECGITAEELTLGGPPVDNVAIDEEGTVTLFRLIGLSGLLGIILAWLCFRSFNITIMIFFVGGLSAITSLAIVWWTGASVDAILMSMPSLVYVLGLSGAVHIVNYYQEAVASHGREGAAERALRHGWGPTTLCAFTTALGLGSLCVSNLAPIQKFGFFSAICVLATLVLLFSFLPAALEAFPPRSARGGREALERGLAFRRMLDPVWTAFGGFIVRRHRWSSRRMPRGIGSLGDRTAAAQHFNSVAQAVRRRCQDHSRLPVARNARGQTGPHGAGDPRSAEHAAPTAGGAARRPTKQQRRQARYQLSFLDRIQLVSRVEQAVQREFGEDGQDVVGQSMSAATFMPELPQSGGNLLSATYRNTFNNILESHRSALLAEDYLRIERGGKAMLATNCGVSVFASVH